MWKVLRHRDDVKSVFVWRLPIFPSRAFLFTACSSFYVAFFARLHNNFVFAEVQGRMQSIIYVQAMLKSSRDEKAERDQDAKRLRETNKKKKVSIA